MQKEMKVVIDDFVEANPDGLEMVILGAILNNAEFMEMFNQDLTFAVLSMLSVMLYFMFHLESVFLAVHGIMIIILSFSLTAKMALEDGTIFEIYC